MFDLCSKVDTTRNRHRKLTTGGFSLTGIFSRRFFHIRSVFSGASTGKPLRIANWDFCRLDALHVDVAKPTVWKHCYGEATTQEIFESTSSTHESLLSKVTFEFTSTIHTFCYICQSLLRVFPFSCSFSLTR